MIPATGGPVVMGMEKRPSREPMAWLAPWAPHRSKAMGPIRVTKQPSKRPMTAQMRSNTSYLCTPASWAVTISMVHTPMQKNESWIEKMLMDGRQYTEFYTC